MTPDDEKSTEINTKGGAYVEKGVNVGGDFVGRDQYKLIIPKSEDQQYKEWQIVVNWGRKTKVQKWLSLAGNISFREFDLAERNLSELNLAKVDLRGADLSRADLSKANLILADLRGAKLEGANLSEAVLWKANLRGLSWKGLTCGGLTCGGLT
jgi:hypothetical protein